MSFSCLPLPFRLQRKRKLLFIIILNLKIKNVKTLLIIYHLNLPLLNEAWNEIKKDITGIGTMNRLIHGDVGSARQLLQPRPFYSLKWLSSFYNGTYRSFGQATL